MRDYDDIVHCKSGTDVDTVADQWQGGVHSGCCSKRADQLNSAYWQHQLLLLRTSP